MSYEPGEAVWSESMGADESSINHRKPFVPQAGALLAEAGAVLSLLPPPPARVLDAGCADGHLSWLMALQGYEVFGVDVCADELGWAHGHGVDWRGVKCEPPHFVVGDYDSLAAREAYDAVVFSGALHHSVDRTVTLKSAFHALKPGGVAVAVEPGFGHGWSAASRDARCRLGVTERSCPPAAVVWAGWRAGFRGVKVYPHPGTIAKVVYSRRCAADNGFVRLFRAVPFSAGLLVAAKWLHGVTVLTKPARDKQD